MFNWLKPRRSPASEPVRPGPSPALMSQQEFRREIKRLDRQNTSLQRQVKLYGLIVSGISTELDISTGAMKRIYSMALNQLNTDMVNESQATKSANSIISWAYKQSIKPEK
jgi:DNA-directed RNA polymerase specialized sigma24 family protein